VAIIGARSENPLQLLLISLSTTDTGCTWIPLLKWLCGWTSLSPILFS